MFFSSVDTYTGLMKVFQKSLSFTIALSRLMSGGPQSLGVIQCLPFG